MTTLNRNFLFCLTNNISKIISQATDPVRYIRTQERGQIQTHPSLFGLRVRGRGGRSTKQIHVSVREKRVTENVPINREEAAESHDRATECSAMQQPGGASSAPATAPAAARSLAPTPLLLLLLVIAQLNVSQGKDRSLKSVKDCRIVKFSINLP